MPDFGISLYKYGELIPEQRLATLGFKNMLTRTALTSFCLAI